MKPIFYLLLLLPWMACKEKYLLPDVAPATGYLVVEGNINIGSPTTITLTRTNSLISQAKIFEKNATVLIEGKNNTVYTLHQSSPGVYSADALQLDNSVQYRLHITTSSGDDYQSDFVAVKVTPEIDSISWIREPGGVRMYVNAHDDNDATRYYTWDYNETWEFHSPYLSVLSYDLTFPDRPSIRYRDSMTYSYDPAIFKCWKSRASTNLLLGSTAKLTQDRVYLPVNYIPVASKEISVLYSINVRQFAVSKEAYEFLEKMKKNTESTGSIFDPQPSTLKGNIHCLTKPSEPVIGYLNISSLQEKRIFIYNSEVGNWNYQAPCQRAEIRNVPDTVKQAYEGQVIPTEVGQTFNGRILTFFGTSDKTCVDCTLTGTNVKPDFWP